MSEQTPPPHPGSSSQPYTQPRARPPVPGSSAPDAATPSRARPSGWWFALGVALVIAAGVIFAVVLWRTVSDFVAVDATVPADGEPHVVGWADEGERMVWVRERDDTDCTILDAASGEPVEQRDVMATYTRSTGGPTWVGSATFSAPSGRVEVTCATAYGPIQIGPAPTVGGFAGGIAVAIIALLVLGLAGVAVLVVTGVLFATRGPRRDRAAPPPPAGPTR